MSFVPTSNQHQAPYDVTPALSQKQLNTGTWGAGGNTCVITDGKIHLNADVHVIVTGTTPAAGQWSYVVAEGTLTITSSDSENSALPLSYVVY